MYDIHCHIMPGMDDGAENIDDSLEMLIVAASGGTKGLICTPHCNIPGLYRNYYDSEFQRRIIFLQNLADRNEIPVKVYPGQEIFLAGPIPRLISEGKLITLNNSVYMLCEFDPGEPAGSVYGKLEYIIGSGYIPIVAHPERYGFVISDSGAAKKLKDLGAFLQLDKDSIIGDFGSAEEETAHDILSRRLADFIASDAHTPFMRSPSLREVHKIVCDYYSLDYANFLLRDNPLKVIENKKIYSFDS